MNVAYLYIDELIGLISSSSAFCFDSTPAPVPVLAEDLKGDKVNKIVYIVF